MLEETVTATVLEHIKVNEIHNLFLSIQMPYKDRFKRFKELSRK